MVHLNLTPYRGNHQRFFPHSGYLGLTPVVVQGTVRTRLEEDRRPYKAASVVVRVRCYEADLTNTAKKTGKKRLRVLYEQADRVWAKTGDEEWSPLGDFSAPFRIVLPVDAGGVTTSTFKTFRVWWQVEAVIYHKPSSVMGSRKLVSHQLPLTRYSPSPLAFTLPAPSWSSSTIFHGLQYSVSAAKCVYGPNDQLELDVFFHRADHAVSIKKVQVSLDRHLVIDTESESGSPPSGSDDDDDIRVPDLDELYSPPLEDGVRSDRPTTKLLPNAYSPFPSPATESSDPGSYFAPRPHIATTTSAIIPSIPIRQPQTTNILAFETDEVLYSTPTKLVGTIPKARSLYRYSIGETLRTSIAHIHFTLAVKVHVRTQAGSIEVLELDALPVAVTAASNEDRNNALANAGRLMAIADAEKRLFDPAVPTTPAKKLSRSALGVRRSSNFMLSVSTTEASSLFGKDPLPSPTRSVGSSSRLEDLEGWPPVALQTEKAVRKRSEQWEAFELPVKSRAKFYGRSKSRSPSPSPPPVPLVAAAPPAYVEATAGRTSPLVQPDSPLVEPGTPTMSMSSLPPTFSDVSTPNSLHLPSNDLTRRTSRPRAGRASGPYSRPRSAGAQSTSSQRSKDDSSCGGSVSGFSISSSGASTRRRFSREKSAPLPSSSTTPSQEYLLLPLSLYPPSSPPSSENISAIPSSDAHQSSIIPIPGSPTLSDYSTSSNDSITPPQHSSPAFDFHSFSLSGSPSRLRDYDMASRSAIAPWIDVEVGPFDRDPVAPSRRAATPPVALFTPATEPRRASIPVIGPGRVQLGPSPLAPNTSRLLSPAARLEPTRGTSPNVGQRGRRKSSVGFGLFGKSAGDDEEPTTKESGRWGFLRRSSKV